MSIKQLFAEHMDLVPTLFEFLEQAEALGFGGEGSGNWGHEGRPGEIGGSGEGGGEAPAEGSKESEKGDDKPKSLLRQVEDKMRAEGALPPASKVEPSKVEPAKAETAQPAKDLKTIEKEYKVVAGKHKEEYEKYKEMNKAAWDEKDSKTRVAKMDAANKEKDRILNQYSTEDKPNSRSTYHKELANKLPEEQIRSELSQRFGDGVNKIGSDKVREVYASVSHNEEVIGKSRFSEIVQKIEVAPLKGRRVAAYSEKTKRIVINSNKAELKGWDAKDEDGTRFHPYAGGSPTKAVIDHEIGHAIYGAMTSGSGKISRVATVFGRDGVSRVVSGYASTKSKELAAECWAAAMNGNPNTVVQYVAGLMKG